MNWFLGRDGWKWKQLGDVSVHRCYFSFALLNFSIYSPLPALWVSAAVWLGMYFTIHLILSLLYKETTIVPVETHFSVAEERKKIKERFSSCWTLFFFSAFRLKKSTFYVLLSITMWAIYFFLKMQQQILKIATAIFTDFPGLFRHPSKSPSKSPKTAWPDPSAGFCRWCQGQQITRAAPVQLEPESSLTLTL